MFNPSPHDKYLDQSKFKSFADNNLNVVKLAKFVFNPLPDDKILDQTKLKAFADDKLSVIKMIISVFDRVEKIVGKGEIACTNNFSFSHNVFKWLLSQTRQKVSLCRNGLIGKKTLREKEKMLVTSIFSFSPNVFKSSLCSRLLKVGIVC